MDYYWCFSRNPESMKLVLLMSLLVSYSLELMAQKEVIVQDMKFSYRLQDGEIEMELEAPTRGWVGVGFNDQNSIVKSDLLLFRVVGKRVEAVDMYVVGFGNPKEDTTLGGTMDIRDLEGIEEQGRTKIRFRLPFPATDPHDFAHQLNRQFWLILAYSTHDDFDHHSSMRKHQLFAFTDKP